MGKLVKSSQNNWSFARWATMGPLAMLTPGEKQRAQDAHDKGAKKDQPTMPAYSPDATDQAVQNARLFERRQQLGLMGRMSTFLTTGQRQQAPATPQSVNPPTTYLGQ